MEATHFRCKIRTFLRVRCQNTAKHDSGELHQQPCVAWKLWQIVLVGGFRGCSSERVPALLAHGQSFEWMCLTGRGTLKKNRVSLKTISLVLLLKSKWTIGGTLIGDPDIGRLPIFENRPF